MAFWTRSDGGRGFSLEASLMASLMASSRSTSSMGFPGSYGAMPRMCSLASDSQEADMEGSLCGRIGPENLEELAALLDRAKHVSHVVGVPVPLEVQEVHVLPGAPLGGPRFDLGQVEPALGEGLQDAVEDARLVAHGEEDRGLVPSRGRHRPGPPPEGGGGG